MDDVTEGREHARVASIAMKDGDGPVCEHFQRAAEIVARRWTPQLIRVLLVGPARYRDLKAAIPQISDHLLSARLKELETAGIVSRSVEPGPPVLIEYHLTKAGEGLSEVIESLGDWAERFARRAPSTAS
jgi:DNA-binding HxlR family transcriptional regulator